MKRSRCWAGGVVCGALLLGASCGKQDEPPPEPVRPIVTMTVGAPQRGRVRTFSGTARADVETLIGFRVGGELVELPVKRGQRVTAGQLFARLDTRDYDLQVKQNEAQLAQSDAQLEQARADYERVRQLYEARSVSKSDLDGQQAAFKSAVAQREAALKALEMARQQLEYCTLLAPFAGSIASVPVEVHQTVSAGQTIATMTSGDELVMALGIPEALIDLVVIGAPAQVRFDAIPGVAYQGAVSEIGIQPDSSSTYPVELRLLNIDARVRSGMIGEAVFTFFSSADDAAVILVPSVAVVPKPDGTKSAWVYDPTTQTVQSRTVEVGDLTSDGLQIRSGLKEGDILAIRGVHQLREGQRVRLLDE